MAVTQIRFRRGSSLEWQTANPVLAEGEPGVDTTLDRFKIGDGESDWATLPFQSFSTTQLTQVLNNVQAALEQVNAISTTVQQAGATAQAAATAATAAAALAGSGGSYLVENPSDPGTFLANPTATFKPVGVNAASDFPPRVAARLAATFATLTAMQNAVDAVRQRGNHLGTQTSSTISDFTAKVQQTVVAMLSAGSNVVLTTNSNGTVLSIASTATGGGGGGTGSVILGDGLISVVTDSTAGTVTIRTNATANSTDAALRDRSTHTGTQPISSIAGLQSALASATGGGAAVSLPPATPGMTGLRGLNLAGPDFGGGAGFGYASNATIAAMAARGHRLIRQPFRWDMMQPSLGNALAAIELSEMHRVLDAADAAGMGVILDCHDYGGYGGKTGVKIGATGGPTIAQFANLWLRLATEFGTHQAVYGYDLMNEPENMPVGSYADGRAAWYAAAQAAITSIRTVDKHTFVIVASYNFGSAMGTWQNGLGGGFAAGTVGVKDKYVVTDTAGTDNSRVMFTAHHYWSSNYNYAQGITANANYPNPNDDPNPPFRDVLEKAKIGELRSYLNWLTAQQTNGLIGEWGIVRNDSTSTNADAELWGRLADRWFEEINSWQGKNPNLRVWVTQWAGGDPWSPTYNQRMYAPDNTPYLPGLVGERNPTIPAYPEPPPVTPVPKVYANQAAAIAGLANNEFSVGQIIVVGP